MSLRGLLFLATTAATLFLAAGCNDGPNTLVTSGYDEAEMEAAMEQARQDVGTFIAELDSPTGTDHAVKAPVEDNGQVEHVWLTDVAYNDGTFKGTINAEPGIVTNVKVGQSRSIKKDEMSDWMYMRDGKMHGNYTMRPLLKHLPEDEADEVRSILADL